MSNHLRHCPKHRKPLPCAHCAFATSVPTPVAAEPAAPVEPLVDLTCEYHRAGEQWVCVYCSHNASQDDITASGVPAARVCSARNILRQNREMIGKELDKKFQERERRATAAKERRKKKADQLAAIKKALKTPIAAIKEAAKVKAEAGKLPSMNQGKYMSDAPTGKGALVYKPASKIDQIDAAISRSVPLGSQTIDHETGEAFFADNDRERIAPEGVGASSDEKPEITGVSRDKRQKGFTYGYGEEEPNRKFQVRLTGPEYQAGLDAALIACTLPQESETFCRLCKQGFGRIENHFTQAHGDPLEPGHDNRFGDVVQKYVKRVKRAHARLEKAGRAVALEAVADQKARAEIEAIQNGYRKLKGEWVRPKLLKTNESK